MTRNLTAAQRWRLRRNLVIFAAHRGGISQRVLADVFCLARSRVAAILREVDVLARSRQGGEDDMSDGANAFRPVPPRKRGRVRSQ